MYIVHNVHISFCVLAIIKIVDFSNYVCKTKDYNRLQQNVSDCIRLYKTRLYSTVQDCKRLYTRTYNTVQNYTGLQNVHDCKRLCTRTNKTVQNCTGLYRMYKIVKIYILDCTIFYKTVQNCIRLYRMYKTVYRTAQPLIVLNFTRLYKTEKTEKTVQDCSRL